MFLVYSHLRVGSDSYLTPTLSSSSPLPTHTNMLFVIRKKKTDNIL